ncbi:MAG: hypothetical protein K2X46_17845 [Roseomonas sp.]|nr:hypothetical protein [Roseomonas sp.]
MRDLTDFLPHVMLHAMACADPVAVKYLREAAVEFCTRTRVWRETDEFTTVADDIEVVCVPPYAALHEIEAAWFNGYELEAARFKQTFGPDEQEGGQPRWITQVAPDRVSLVPKGAGLLRISMFLKPAEDTEVVPAFLFDHFAREIGWGALRDLKMLPNQPFSDPQMGMAFGARFEAALNRFSAANIRGQQRAKGRANARYF